MKVHKFGPLHNPEQHDAHDKQGVFAEASRAAQLEGKAFFGEGQQGHAVSGAHVEQHVGKRPEAEASHDGVGQRAELSGKGPRPDGQPPAEPVGGPSMDLVELLLSEEGAVCGALVHDVGHHGACPGRGHAHDGKTGGKGGHEGHGLMGGPFHALLFLSSCSAA